MFGSAVFSRAGLFLMLILAMGMGPGMHGHSTAPDETAHTTQEVSHFHDDDSDVVALRVAPEDRSGDEARGHSHPPPTLDHAYDSWALQARVTISPAAVSAFPAYMNTHPPHETAPGRIEKPPRAPLQG